MVSDQTVGFAGFGNLGRAMIDRLRSQGQTLLIWNRTHDKVRQAGYPAANSLAELAERCPVLLLCLFDSAAVRTVLAELTPHLGPGHTVIDFTTNHPEQVLSFHEVVRQKHAAYLECPIMGSVVPASKGELGILISGERSTYEAVEPLITTVTSRRFFVETPGMASRLKLVNNLVLGSFMASLSEAVKVGDQLGIDRQTCLEILSSGAGNSAVLNAKREKLRTGDYTPHFSVSAIAKDLAYLDEMVQASGGQTPVLQVMLTAFSKAEQRGDGSLDFSAVFKNTVR